MNKNTKESLYYQVNKMIDLYGEDALLGESDDYVQILADYKIWLREMFISVPLIIEAFSTKNNVNDALVHIWDNINEDSYYVFNIQMIPNNDGKLQLDFNSIVNTINTPRFTFSSFFANRSFKIPTPLVCYHFYF